MQSNLDVRVVLALVEERESRLRRTNILVIESHLRRRRVRRWVGRQLIGFGSRLAGEPTTRPVRAR